MNPWNKYITNATRSLYTRINELKSVPSADGEELLRLINTTNVKKYYLSMEFNRINNDEFMDPTLYPLNIVMQFKRTPLYTPQINNISMMMPSAPVLYNWKNIERVFFVIEKYKVKII